MPWLPSSASSPATTSSIGISGRPTAGGSSPTCTCRPRGRRLRIELPQVTAAPRASRETWTPPPVSSATAVGTSTVDPSSTCSAPNAAASSRAPGATSPATTRAPAATATWTADSPTPPQPCTATHSPGRTRPTPVTARNAVANRQPRLAAVANGIASGSATRLTSAASSTTYSASDPQWVNPGWVWCRHTCPAPSRHGPQRPQAQTKGTVTRSPTAQLRTPSPTAATVPANSCPGTCGTTTSGSCPDQACQSLRQMPLAPTRTTTPSRAGDGSSTERTVSGPPNSSNTSARTAAEPALRHDGCALRPRGARHTGRVDDLSELRRACDRALAGHGPSTAADLLATIPPDTALDRYGDGGVVAELEEEVAEVLGQPAAVYLPSGIMAQQAALRVHAEHRGRRAVVYHPQCHLEVHEGRALERLQGLVGRPAGDRDRLLLRSDLDAVAEPPAALLVELPQRDLGGRLPSWEDLVAQVTWARERGAAAHLDGARLWEAAAGYGRPPPELAALFDTTYVSFYKGIGALSGCCLAGPADVVAQVREWRRRMGGTLFGLWPGAASALTCLRRRLPLMPGYLVRAREIADAVRDLPGVTVVPDPPQTPMLHLLLRAGAEQFTAAVRTLAESGLWTWERAMPTADPAVQRVELPVGDATTALPLSEIRPAIATLAGADR